MNSAFGRLLLKDWVRTWPTLVVILCLYAAVLVYYGSRAEGDAIQAYAMLLLGAGPMVIPVLFLWRSFALQEWRSDQLYFLLSLPTPGWYVVVSRLLTVWIELVLYACAFLAGIAALLAVGGPLLLTEGGVAGALDWISFLLRWALLAALVSAPIAIAAQFSYLAGRSVRTASGLVTAFLFITSLWLLFRVATAISTAIGGEITYRFWMVMPSGSGGMLIPILVDLLPVLLIFALSLILFFLGVRLFEDVVEV